MLDLFKISPKERNKNKETLYLKELKEKLKKIFLNKKIKIRKGLKIKSHNVIKTYSPQIDATIGPFAINKTLEKEYKRLSCRYKDFIREIRQNSINRHDLNFKRNPNPRCFIAIEIEDKTQDLKHILGSICNAFILGKVGIVVAYDQNKLNKIHEYLKFAFNVGKTKEYLFENVALISKKQFDKIIKKLA